MRGIPSCAAGQLAPAAFLLRAWARRLAVPLAAGVLAVAALPQAARAEPSAIAFTSGPLAGVAAEDVTRKEEDLANRGTKVSESALFQSNGMLAYVNWARLTSRYVWQNSDLKGLTEEVRQVFKAADVTVLSGDRDVVKGFRVQYRDIRLSRPDRRCGLFEMQRMQNDIFGFVCRADDQQVPILAVMEGLAIKDVIGP